MAAREGDCYWHTTGQLPGNIGDDDTLSRDERAAQYRTAFPELPDSLVQIGV